MNSFQLGVLIFFVVYVVALVWLRRTRLMPFWPVVVILATPLLLKLELGDGIYIHPAFLLITGYWVALATIAPWRSAWNSISRWRLQWWSVLPLGLVLFGAIQFYGIVVAVVRYGSADVSEVFRAALYTVGASIFGTVVWVTSRHNIISSRRFSQILVGVVTFFAILGLGRIGWFVWHGGYLDYWAYGPDYQALGTLGQYVGLHGLGVINSGAAEQSGWLMNMGSFASLVLALDAWRHGRKAMTAVWAGGAAILIAGNLYTLSRADIIEFYVGIVMLIGLATPVWKNRLIAGAAVAAASAIIILLFPNAPFITKSSNTVSVTTHPVATPTPAVGQQKPKVSPTLATHAAKVKPKTEETDVELEPSAAGRIAFWKRTIQLWTKSPANMVFGVGAIDLRGRYGLVPHSMFLQWLVRYGVLGLVSFTVLWGTLWYWAWLIWKHIKPEDPYRFVAWPVLMILPGWTLSNLFFGASMLSIELLIVFWGMIGLVYEHVTASKQA